MRMFANDQVSSALVLGAALAVIISSPVFGQSAGDASIPAPREPMIQPAIDGIFEAFQTHPLVGLSDAHGLAQEMEFYEELIRDPRFARDVGNVVVEFGGAARQDVIDHYVNGELVPYKELRQVWTDTVGWLPTVHHLGYAHFFAQVRETNAKLPQAKRIRVWLGEPPIVWEKIKTRDDLRKFQDRDGHVARVIIQNILVQGKKALVIYGGQHFGRVSKEEKRLRAEWAEADPEDPRPTSLMLQGQVEAEHPDAFFIVQVYKGFNDEACTSRFEQGMENWPMPAIAAPLQGTTLESKMRQCYFKPNIIFNFPPKMPQGLQDLLRAQANDVLFRGDAILFLGPEASLTKSPMFPDLYLDEEYRQEIKRHMEIMGIPWQPGWGRDIPVTPRKYD